MMKRWLLPLLLLFYFTALRAQNATQDSIRSYYQKLSLEKEDTSRAKTLYILAYYYQFYNLDSSIILGRTAYSLSKKHNFEKGMARSSGIMAGAYNKLGNYNKALEYYFEALKILEKLKDPDDICRANLNIALLYSSRKESDKALEYAFKSFSIAQKNKLNDLIIYITLDIGNMYTDINRLDSARYYTHLALDSSISQKNELITGTAYLNLGNIFFKKGQLPAAIENYYRGVPILLSNQDYNNLCESYLGLAKSYDSQQNWDSAKLYGNLAYQLATENAFLQQRMNASQFLTALYSQHNTIDSAFIYQRTYMSLKDSFDNNEKQRELHNLTMNEALRQEEIVRVEKEQIKERKVKLQLLLIGMLIPLSFLVSAFISKKKVSKRMVELSGIFSLLFLFEYITLLLHPVVAERSGHSPIIEIVIFVILAAILSPAHHKIEQWFVTRLTKRHHHHTTKNSAEKEKQKENPPSA